MIKKILITTDFSEESFKAFSLEKFGFDLKNIEILLTSVFDETIMPTNLMVNIPNYQNLISDAKEAAEQKLDELKSKFPSEVKVTTKLISCLSPCIGTEITSFASEHGVDTIVISSHGRGAIGTLFLGSVAQKVISSAKCPVLVIPKNS